jgi:hypothetical protein
MAVKIIGKQQPQKAAEPANAAPKAKKHRIPTKRGYSVKVYQRLFQFIGEGDTLAQACARPGMPSVWTARRRLQTDELLKTQYDQVLSIKFHALVDELPNKALEGIAKVSAADRLTAAKQRADNIKWVAQRILDEYKGDGEGGNVVFNVTGAAEIPAVSQPDVPQVAEAAPLKIVKGGNSA